ncbi:MAG TPA: hypothetical protein PKV21_06470 [bacterium]|nr:hypothetical protein [bacterium]
MRIKQKQNLETSENLKVKNIKKGTESIKEFPQWTIRKFKSEEDYKKNNPYAVESFEGNLLTEAGADEMSKLCFGTGGTKYAFGNTYLIVGTGTGTESDQDTEATFTNGVKKLASSITYGTDKKTTIVAVFGPDDANQDWQEFGTLNALTSGVLLNRKVINKGTKASGDVWELTEEISLS